MLGVVTYNLQQPLSGPCVVPGLPRLGGLFQPVHDFLQNAVDLLALLVLRVELQSAAEVRLGSLELADREVRPGAQLQRLHVVGLQLEDLPGVRDALELLPQLEPAAAAGHEQGGGGLGVAQGLVQEVLREGVVAALHGVARVGYGLGAGERLGCLGELLVRWAHGSQQLEVHHRLIALADAKMQLAALHQRVLVLGVQGQGGVQV
mmetsp:Transcript_11184/g.24850  ORF Transcript_11184/g.24850 Transcript_11184/m.24850 type:complete len:206 (+) Transcript_11184:335-952(+)